MAIDMASVYAKRFEKNPDMLRAAVMGQSPDPKLDSYTALNALRLLKESQMMTMAGQAQQPTSSPSLVAENMAPNPMMQGLGAMVPGAMGQAPQGQAPRAMPQQPMQAASGGLAGMSTPDEDYAAGGIVAFQAGGETEEDYQRETSDTGYSDAQGRRTDAEGNLMEDADAGKGSGSALEKFNTMLLKQAAKIGSNKPVTISPTERKALFKEFLAQETENAGPDIYKEEIARGAQDDADRAKARKVGEANALFTAAGKVLKGNRLATGLSEALPAYGSEMNRVEQADQAAKTANSRAQFALKDAQRKERSGNIRAANTAMESYRKFIQDENKATTDRDIAIANIAKSGAMANKPTGKGAGSGPKYQEQILQNNVDYFKSTLKPKPNEAPEAFDARVRKMASDETARALKTSFSTGEIGGLNAATRLAPVQATVDTRVNEGLTKFKETSASGAPYRRALRAGNTEEANRILKTEEARLREVFKGSEAATGGAPAPAPAPTPAKPAASKPTTATKVVSMADVDATVASSGKTRQEVIDALNAKGYTIK
jgi:hypothetical protein